MSEKHIYKVIFVNRGQVYEVYAKSVYQGGMIGFVIVEGFIFGEKSAIVIDPGEEKIRLEFEGVSRSFIPVHEVIRIDQVERQGVAKVVGAQKALKSGGNVASLYIPDKK